MSVGGKVLVVGAGGLGCPASLALAHLGAAHIELADSDVVEASNLPRQLWYGPSDIGRHKAEVCAERLRAIFPEVFTSSFVGRVDESNADQLLRECDIAIDATDGAEAKFLMSDASVRTGVPLVHGGALGFVGQAWLVRPGGPCVRCLFESPQEGGLSCGQSGILGSVVGSVGIQQALLAVGHLAGERREGPSELLWQLDGRNLTARQVEIHRRADCSSCGASRERARCVQ
jgi:adenylyltransferase/sulfurtransferase